MLDLTDYIELQREWSEIVFGEGRCTKGLIEHIRLELEEIERAPDDVREWVDVIILALDGAWRAGHSPKEIVRALCEKQLANIQRKWPQNTPEGTAIQHIPNVPVAESANAPTGSGEMGNRNAD